MIVIFDFDETLFSNDLVKLFITHRIKKNLIKTFVAILMYPFLFPFLKIRRTRYFAARFFMVLVRLGVSRKNYFKIEREFCTNLFQIYPKEKFYKDALGVLQNHSVNGHKILIVTASLSRMVRNVFLPKLREIGVSAVILGSQERDYCFHARKVEKILALGQGHEPPWLACYSDSFHDLPMFLKSEKKFLVNPNRHTLRRAKKFGTQYFEILRWK